MNNKIPVLLTTAGLVILVWGHADAQVVEPIDPTGFYKLVSVDGEKLPATVSHGNAQVEVRSGSFAIKADKTCESKTIFGPPSGADVTREVTATFTQNGPTLTMQWKGAGLTSGTIKGNRFSMNNEGTIFTYLRQPGSEVLDKFVGTWRSVQTSGANPEERAPVKLTYRHCLDGKYVQEIGEVSGHEAAMILYTYNGDKNEFRLWRFAASDPPSEATGKWNTDNNTLEWTYAANSKQKFTMTASHRFLNDNSFEWNVVGTDNNNQILFEMKGKATRIGSLRK